jgi:two-component system response regulator GlrR
MLIVPYGDQDTRVTAVSLVDQKSLKVIDRSHATKARLLVVDDRVAIRHLLKLRLEAADYAVTVTQTARDTVEQAAEETYDLALVDVGSKEQNELVVLQELLERRPGLPVIIMTAHATIASAVATTKAGAFDYLAKPFDMTQLLQRIENALEVRRLRVRLEQLRAAMCERYQSADIIATSEPMQQLLQQVVRIAPTDSTVCVYGESGTGKELIAKAIHATSRRAPGPFVAIDCGAIPADLLESELFGHLRGAYTGADRARQGLLQQADGGSLLLDEIGELPLALQVKLLRVLQEREFYPLGAAQPTRVNVRLIVATNRHLQQQVAEGKFREDLFYRIHVLPLMLPPLRERPTDIVPLAQHFLRRVAQEVNKDVRDFTPEALQRLLQYDWPGNVRELANVIERAVVLTPTTLITPDLLLLGKLETLPARSDMRMTLRTARRNFERQYLIQVLTTGKGSMTEAAKLAGKDRTDLYRLVRKHGLDPAAFRDEKIPTIESARQ